MANRFDDLKNRASANFDKYLAQALAGEDGLALPTQRMSNSEWQELNTLLAPRGIKLVPIMYRGAPYMQFVKTEKSVLDDKKRFDDLKNRASANFDKYLAQALAGEDRAALPTQRMSNSEWQELNTLLAPRGIKLVPIMYRGAPYMQFVKTEKSVAFNRGAENVRILQFNEIRQRFPTLSDQLIQKIIDLDISGDADIGSVYKLLRHAPKDKPYNSKESDFNRAVQYGATDNAEVGVRVFEYQAWTWSRKRRPMPGDPAPQHSSKGDLFHISLNVHVTEDLLRALDAIVANDKHGFIDYYKFPKRGYFDEVLYRHDPITIYTYGRNPEIERQIAAVARQYARSNEGLLGELLGPGISIAPETSLKTNRSVGQQAAFEIMQILSKHARSY